MNDKGTLHPKDNPIRDLKRASSKEIETELFSRTTENLVANKNSGGSWSDHGVIQILNNELTGRYVKRTTTLALCIAGLSLAVSFAALSVAVLIK